MDEDLKKQIELAVAQAVEKDVAPMVAKVLAKTNQDNGQTPNNIGQDVSPAEAWIASQEQNKGKDLDTYGRTTNPNKPTTTSPIVAANVPNGELSPSVNAYLSTMEQFKGKDF